MDESSTAYNKIMKYIDANPAAVVSTVDSDRRPHGAVVYVCTASHHTVCFITKNQTKKFGNLSKHPDVSLTFVNELERSTLQAAGKATVTDDKNLMDYIMQKAKDAHAMQAGWLPPISELYAGDYVVVAVELSYARLSEFQSSGFTGEPIFTEIGTAPEE